MATGFRWQVDAKLVNGGGWLWQRDPICALRASGIDGVRQISHLLEVERSRVRTWVNLAGARKYEIPVPAVRRHLGFYKSFSVIGNLETPVDITA
jgi:hypothetical protein